MRNELTPQLLGSRAIVYVRQSTAMQAENNLESKRLQYALADLAREYGFRDVVVIDEDLGRSASGAIDRPGFRNLLAQICEGTVGAVFCSEASRLSRNGRDWQQLLELCGFFDARVIDPDGAIDPSIPNDRLLLGLKGTISEFELTIMRRRLREGALAKAARGELRIPVPTGFVWPQDTGLEMDPDKRVQDAIYSVFRLFDRLGSARQVLLYIRSEGMLFPRSSDGRTIKEFVWRAPGYRNIITVLQNPFYAGAYVYGKSRVQTEMKEGRMRKRYGRVHDQSNWTVLIRDHHSSYISWEQFELNRERLARNAFGKRSGNAKSGRGGQALLSGLLRCRRCGRMLTVTYSGRKTPLPRYHCNVGHAMHGLARCITFSARLPDEAIAREVLLAVQPLSLEAALVAQRDASNQTLERERALQLEREQAQYAVQIAARRYQSVDPDNRLVAAELETRWNAAIKELQTCEAKIEADLERAPTTVSRNTLVSLSEDLEAAWQASTTDMKTKQRLIRTLIEEIVVDIDEDTREVVLLIHWRGGQHSELRTHKPRTGEHRNRAPEQASALIREMATQWSDTDIAATLNRMGLKTGQGNTWNAMRVGSYRLKHDVPAYKSAVKDGQYLTMTAATKQLGVSSYLLRRLIESGVLPARQVVKDAPWQIRAVDLERPEFRKALQERRRRGRPSQNSNDRRTLRIPGI